MKNGSLKDLIKGALVLEALRQHGQTLLPLYRIKVADLNVSQELVDWLSLFREKHPLLPYGIQLLKEDPGADIANSFGFTYPKKGGAAYFLNYVGVMAATKALSQREEAQKSSADRIAELDLKFEQVATQLNCKVVEIEVVLKTLKRSAEAASFADVLRLMEEARVLQKKQLDGLASIRRGLTLHIGYLDLLEKEIPDNPKGIRPKMAVWLWKKFGGITSSDIPVIQKLGDEFIAKHSSDPLVKTAAV